MVLYYNNYRKAKFHNHEEYKYRVILKKVSFGIFSVNMVSKEEKNFTMKRKDEVLCLSKFS